MANILVTGAAGFVGSHTLELAVRNGHEVAGLDSFNDYYEPALKERNAKLVESSCGIKIQELDLLSADLEQLISGVDVLVHLAGQPGVRASWSEFSGYLTQNVAVTEKLLQACQRAGVKRVVYASSSSVYGNAPSYPVTEEALTVPSSPYGVTKLAGELLCRAYAENFGLHTVALRYFTVYGPRQRPDMAIQRLILAGLSGSEFTLHGDGRQIRDFTFVGDVAAANLAAMTADVPPGSVMNISGGSSTDMLSVIAAVESAIGCRINLRTGDPAPGDVRQTGGDNSLARRLLKWSPQCSLQEGIAAQARFEAR